MHICVEGRSPLARPACALLLAASSAYNLCLLHSCPTTITKPRHICQPHPPVGTACNWARHAIGRLFLSFPLRPRCRPAGAGLSPEQAQQLYGTGLTKDSPALLERLLGWGLGPQTVLLGVEQGLLLHTISTFNWPVSNMECSAFCMS